ncbi:MAG: glycosyltransferase [Desulfotomaculum sp.]|nr:glycosyltransferase [Desulfotomaculum sp.]
MKDNLLTIGIPTYNRKEAVAERVRELIAASVHDIVNILIIDNNSPDGTFEHLKKICDSTGIRVLKNPKNLGAVANFVRLFQKCQTEYLIITSDEDPVIPSQLESLIAILSADDLKNKPLFISPQFFLADSTDKKPYRGVQKIDLISPQQFRGASFYMSGLVYKVAESKQALTDIKFHIKQPGQVYPLILLTAELLMRGPCFWWDKPLAEKKAQLPTCADESHGKYYHLPARWHQHKLFVDFFEDRIKKINDLEKKKIVIQMFQAQQMNFIYELRHSIQLERPDILPYFDKGMTALYCKNQ